MDRILDFLETPWGIITWWVISGIPLGLALFLPDWERVLAVVGIFFSIGMALATVVNIIEDAGYQVGPGLGAFIMGVPPAAFVCALLSAIVRLLSS